jgi:HSP20 family protein
MSNNHRLVTVSYHSDRGAHRPEENVGFSFPATDVYESPRSFVLMIDMPGVKKEAIVVSLEKSRLVIRGVIEGRPSEANHVLHSELRAAGYYRVFNLGGGIEQAGVTASFENGVLTVSLPKRKESQVRQININ